MRGQQTRARLLPLDQDHVEQVAGDGLHRRLHLGARGKENQCAVGNVLDVLHQPCHHLGGVGGGILGVGLRGNHGQRALSRVIERAGHFQGLHMLGIGKPRFAQEEIKRTATGQRSRCHDRTTHLAPQELA